MDGEVKGTVEQVFSRAVNLFIPEQNSLYTLLSPSCDNAPNSCRIALEHCDKFFRPGEQVIFYKRGITVGHDKFIDFSRCKPWLPEALCFKDSRRWQSIADLINESIKDSASLFYYQGPNAFYQEIARLLQVYRGDLLQSLKIGDDTAITTAGINLIGLGIGLTPTGDDYLTGLSAILFIPDGPGRRYLDVFNDIQESGKEKTTLLSAITLREAISQRYREVIHRFIFQINQNDSQNIQQVINEIKRIGSSSGCDMLYGMADALALTAYFGGKNVNQDCD